MTALFGNAGLLLHATARLRFECQTLAFCGDKMPRCSPLRCLLFLATGAVFSAHAAARVTPPHHRGLNTTHIGNAIVDEMLRVFRLNEALVERLTPLRVPGELSFPGGSLHDVRVLGLPALERRGDVAASLSGGVLTLSGGLGLDELLVQSRYSAGPRQPLQLEGEIDGRVTNITAGMQLTANVAQARAVLDVFKVPTPSHCSHGPYWDNFSDIGNVQVTRMTGATPAFNWLGVVIMNFILEDQADTLRQKLEDEAKAALNKSLENTIIPVTIN
ncbi:hypothetical protein HPB50_008381 [Hyalomma asiaticum]|uniref:Uncharacterized protein n=1 Tax=Hyalomma asiaticum TaxID=266040 RepID=A0ACB7THC2_HYAAI|nr:hypothetical protein HPB50_008381 [Hyalomma asiaticum]